MPPLPRASIGIPRCIESGRQLTDRGTCSRRLLPERTEREVTRMEDFSAVNGLEALQCEVCEMIVEELALEDVIAAEIDHDAPLFSEGLSLDSIDALEIAFAIGEKYGFKLRSDDDRNEEIFSNIKSLSKHISENRTK